MKAKNIILTVVVTLLVSFSLVGCGSNEKAPDNNPEVEETEDRQDTEEEKEEEKETEYGLEEWWEVEDQWKLKIDSVTFTDARNEFSDKQPEAVVVIKYTYENLGYEGDIQDLYITPDNVVDGDKKVASTYPAGSEVSVKPTPIGAVMEGAEESYGLTTSDGEVKIYFNEYDDDNTKHKAIFTIPLGQ